MNQKEFIREVVDQIIRDRTYEEMSEFVNGSEEHEEVQSSLEFVQNLSGPEKDKVLDLVRLAIHITIFKFLAVLDGVKEIAEDGGHLKLMYTSDEGSEVLADALNLDNHLHSIFMQNYPKWLKGSVKS